MPGKFHHESLYRGPELLAKLSALRVALCGAGAIGSNLTDNLARQGVANLRVIDHDRVEERNISTQLYGESDVGVWKVEALHNRLFRATGIEIEPVRKELTGGNARQLLKDGDLIIDAFDNSAGRLAVQEFARAAGVACLHVGLFEDYCEVVWDDAYRVPRDVANDVCDYALARDLVLLSVVIASETIVQWVADGTRTSRSATLRDLAVRELE
jgi:molybdopterin/thiamine biosynthesis adenylyltransferase